MPIANYSTTVSPHRTVGEIQGMLAEAGARDVMVSFENGQPDALQFSMALPPGTLVSYRLPSNWRGVQRTLERQRVTGKYLTEAHARAVAWRITRDWVRAQLAIVEAGLVSMPETMLPYAITNDGRTFAERLRHGAGIPLLEAPT